MLTRRAFLQAAGSLIIPIALPALAVPNAPAPVLNPNSFLEISADGAVTVIVGQAEMGQGVFTALAAVLTEELDAPWASVQVRSSHPEAQFGNPFFNGLQITAASTSVVVFFEPYRKAGAQAREMLVRAAAEKWGLKPALLKTHQGQVLAPDGRTLAYRELLGDAARYTPPEHPKLKKIADFALIGTSPLRLDVIAKSSGKQRYGIDVQETEGLVAVVAHAPSFGALLISFDAAQAQAVPGCHTVVQIPSGVAVLATHTWAALQARKALSVVWDERPGAELSTEKILDNYRALALTPGSTAKAGLSPVPTSAEPKGQLSAEYIAPYLAHLPMEPLNCVIQRQAQRVVLTVGTQFQSQDQQVVANILGVARALVEVRVTAMGGGFGRRANPKSDWIAEAAEILKALPALTAPVKLLWTREDEIAAGYYRPMVLSRIWAKTGADNQLTTWHQRIVGQSACADSALDFLVQKGIDLTTVDGVTTLKYAIPDFSVDVHQTRLPIPVQWMRSVGHSHNVFFVESFIDELAHAAATDPLAYRRALLTDPRLAAVLELAAEKAGWGTPLPAGMARGLSAHEYYGSYVAIVAEVEKTGATVKIRRLVCAADCGLVVNPDGAAAQIQGALVYGLSSALYGGITLERGRALQTNFDTYPVLRMANCPSIESFFVNSSLAPTGLGECGVPSVAPAICNALFALTGQRIRRLPLAQQGISI